MRATINRLVAITLGLLFLAAAAAKLVWPAGALSLFGGLAQAAPWLDWLVVAAEVLPGVWLISGWRRGGAAVGALFLLAVFSGAIVHDMLRRYPEPSWLLRGRLATNARASRD